MASGAECRVKLLAQIDDAIGKLVHPDARAETTDAASHRVFLASRIGLSLVSLALAPLWLVAGPAPAAWEAAALAWLALPFGAALAVSRSGDLRTGEIMSLLAWLGLSVTVSLGTGSIFGLALLLMVPIEAATASSVAVGVGGLGGAALVGLVAGTMTQFGQGAGAKSPSILAAAALVGALAYGGLLAVATARMSHMRRDAERLSRGRYLALTQSLEDVVMRFDRAGAASHVGCAAQRLFGLAPRDLVGRGFFERLHVADRPVFLKLVADVAVEGQSGIGTLRLRTGRTLPSRSGDFDEPVFATIDLSLRPPEPGEALGDDQRPAAAVGLLRDVSARAERDRLAAEAQTSFERSHAGRDLFLANASHELRTPLNAIIGFSEMLSAEALEPADPAKRREYAGIIHQSGLHLLSVVNGVLDASKVQSGSFDLAPELVDLDDLLTRCCDMMGLKAEQGSVRLVRAVATDIDAIVGDQRACKQIVLNLLSNALKFTPSGGQVTLEAKPDGNSVLLVVSDTGVGVSPRDLPRLGDPFFQARTSSDRHSDGTGLGLSVVRGLVGLHGGSMVIESAPGQGTRVTVRLPLDCRGALRPPGLVTKIETISRYSSGVRHDGVPRAGRMHKIA